MVMTADGLLPAAYINPEDLDKMWMEAPHPKSKPAKPAAKAQQPQQQLQKPQQQQQQQLSSLEMDTSHEGFVDHAGDSLDDAAAAGQSWQSCVLCCCILHIIIS